MRKIDITGKRFGRLVVIGEVERKGTRVFWECQCDCGNRTTVESYPLRHGATNSCGCLNNEMRIARSVTHGETETRLYRTWSHIKGRCFTPTDAAYQNYGGRGITMCEEWRNDFTSFRDWAQSHGYREDLTIDRINNNGNYEPSNCRWVSQKIQNRNRRDNFLYKGKCLSDWCEETGLSHSLVLARIRRLGWSIEKALFTPARTFTRSSTKLTHKENEE